MASEHHGPLDRRTLLAAGSTILLWASAFPVIRVALGAYNPGQLALFRFAVASVVLAFWSIRSSAPPPPRRDLPAILLLGLLGVVLYHVALNAGERTVTAGAASLLVNTAPIFTALLATLFLGERLGMRGWSGIGVSFVGAALIALGEGKGLRLSSDALLILLAAVCFSGYAVIAKPYLARYGAQRVSSWVIWFGTLFLLPFGGGLLHAVRAAPLGATLGVIYLGIFPTALSYATWAYTLSRVPAARASSLLYLIPALAILIGWLWLGEIPSGWSLLGGGLALAGVALVHLAARVDKDNARALH